MKKVKFIVLAVVVLSLGTVSGLKAYSGFVKSNGLIQSNIESLTSGDPGKVEILKGYKLGEAEVSNGMTIPCCVKGEAHHECNYTEISCKQITFK